MMRSSTLRVRLASRVVFPSTVLALSAIGIASGCVHRAYEIELRPRDGGLERRLVVSSPNDAGKLRPLPVDELQKLVEIYGEPHRTETEPRIAFAAHFAEVMPEDVGGSGRYALFETPFGSSHVYIERFRGRIDLAARVDELREGVRRIVDFVRGWLEAEFSQLDGYATLARFVDEDLGRDVTDLVLHGWILPVVTGIVPSPSTNQQVEVIARLAQPLIERGYVVRDDLPRLYRSFATGDRDAIHYALVRCLARRLGLSPDEPLPAVLAALRDPDRVESSWLAYVKTRPQFDAWRRQPDVSTDQVERLEEIDWGEVIADVSGTDLVEFELFGPRTVLSLRLESDVEPYATNGVWDAETRRVTWHHKRLEGTFPAFCVALWSVPDRAAQTARFGRVLVEREELAEYALWYHGLAVAERDEWDRFVATLGGGEAALERVAAFRFRGEAADADAGASAGAIVRRIIASTPSDADGE